MQLSIFFLIVTSAYFAVQLNGNSEEINKRTRGKFPIESGKVYYEISGDANGSAQLIFDRNGWRSLETRQYDLERFGIKSSERSLEFWDGDYLYQVNLDAGTGKSKKDSQWSSILRYKSQEEGRAAIYSGMSAKKMRTDTLLDRICGVWAFEKGAIRELWEWRGIPLKVTKKLPGLTYDMRAITIEENVSLPDSAFSIPQDMVWSETR